MIGKIFVLSGQFESIFDYENAEDLKHLNENLFLFMYGEELIYYYALFVVTMRCDSLI